MHSDRSPLLHRCTDRSQTHCQDCCLNYKSRRHHRSASSANAVTPTLSPHSALSFTLLAVVSLSVTALMSNSSASSLILMLNARHYCWNRHPTVAVTSMLMFAEVSKSSALGSFTVTSPVSGSIANALPGLLLKL